MTRDFQKRCLPWALAFLLALLCPVAARAATVAVLPVEGEITDALRDQVAGDIRDALVDRADVVSTADEVRLALGQLGVRGALSLEQLGQLARALDVEFVLSATVTPLPGQYRLELSAFHPSPAGVELLERVVVEVNAAAEIRRMLDELFAVRTSAPTPAPQPEPQPEPAPRVEPAPEPEPEPEPERPRRPRLEYGAQPLEINLAGGPAIMLTEPGQNPQNGETFPRTGGRITVGIGYSFLRAFGLGIRADFIAQFGNADAFGATVGTGIHWAPFGGIPLFIGFRLGLGVLQGSSGARATYFLLHLVPVVAYRIIDIIQIELRPMNFAFLIGDTTVVQYEALLSVGVTLSF